MLLHSFLHLILLSLPLSLMAFNVDSHVLLTKMYHIHVELLIHSKCISFIKII
jgi:hypothetical protein